MPRLTPSLRPGPRGFCYLVRGAERYAVLPGQGTEGPLRGAWHTPSSYPGDARAFDRASRLTEREARLLLPSLSSAHGQGRTPAAPVTEDGRLVAAAVAAGGYGSRAALARACGTTPFALARCNVAREGGTRGSAHPLPEGVIEALRAMAGRGAVPAEA